MELRSTAKTAFTKRRIGLIGPPGTGKTTTAASISKNFDPTFSKPVVLDDVLWFLFDDGGLDSLISRKITVPKYFDFTSVAGTPKEMDPKLPGSLLNSALVQAKTMAADGAISAVVFDTMSALNRRWFAHAVEKFGKNFGTYDEIGARNINFYQEIMPLACDAIFLFQPKPKPENQGDNKAIEGFDQVLDIPSNYGNVYRENMAIWAVRKEVKAGKKEVWVYPNGNSGIEGKDRYDLDDKVEPNLRAVFEKVRAKAVA